MSEQAVTVAGRREVYPCRCGATIGNDGIHLHVRDRHFVVGMTGPRPAVDPAGSPHSSFPHRRVHVTPAAHRKLAGQAHTGTPKAPGTG